MKIGLLSDTHGWIHPSVFKYFSECDEIWHAGDIGSTEVAVQLENFKPFRAVYGNIDDASLRRRYSEHLRFSINELDIWITHIGGYPGRYAPGVRPQIFENPPGLFISGHSHIAKVIPDKNLNLLHINPGAAGYTGYHKVMTLARFTIGRGKVSELELIELGPRSKLID
ncbi:MAG: metallophosphoesterase family protein [Marinilabiliaceae bacterium]|jgi:putative phosphoesterase|nr:metallophosphoesterase family protein [Marinilabiliaceae bacterium]